MAINSVSSSTSANAQLVHAQKQPDRAQQAKQTTQAKQAQQSQSRAQAKPEAEAPKQAAAPKHKPVVNTQGQKTGTVINTTA